MGISLEKVTVGQCAGVLSYKPLSKYQILQLMEISYNNYFSTSQSFQQSKTFTKYKQKREKDIMKFFLENVSIFKCVWAMYFNESSPIYTLSERHFIPSGTPDGIIGKELIVKARKIVSENDLEKWLRKKMDAYFDFMCLQESLFLETAYRNKNDTKLMQSSLIKESMVLNNEENNITKFICYAKFMIETILSYKEDRSEVLEKHQRQLDKVQSKREKEMKDKDEMISYLQSQLSQEKEKHRKGLSKVAKETEKNITEQYHEELSQIRADLKEKEKQLQEVTEELEIMKEDYKLKYEEALVQENLTDSSEINPAIYNMKFLFIGGHKSTLSKLKKSFPKSKFAEDLSERFEGSDIRNVDAVISFSSFISHPLYNKTKKLAKNSDTPFLDINKNGLESVVKELSEFYERRHNVHL